MADQASHRWIVLVQKAPQGPYTAEQIHALLKQGALRRNDVAFLCSPDGRERLSDWKLLWQFPEFDRRNQKPAETARQAPPGAEPPRFERRRDMTPEEIRRAKEAAIPKDLVEIRPEELLLHGRAASAAPDSEPERNVEASAPRAFPVASAGGGGWGKWAIGLGLVLAVVVAVPFFDGSDVPEAPYRSRRGFDVQAPTRLPSARPGSNRSPLSGLRPRPQLPEAPQYAPQPPPAPEDNVDFGEMGPNAYDDFAPEGEPFDEGEVDPEAPPTLAPRAVPPTGRALRPRPPAGQPYDDESEEGPPEAEPFPGEDFEEPPPPEEY